MKEQLFIIHDLDTDMYVKSSAWVIWSDRSFTRSITAAAKFKRRDLAELCAKSAASYTPNTLVVEVA